MKAPFRSCVVAVLALLVFVCTSCLIVTRHPLIDSKKARPDERLKGRWIGLDKLNSSYAAFDGMLLETNIFTGKDPAKQSEVLFDVATGPIGKYRYMSLRPHDEADAEYLLVRYFINGNELKVWVLDSPLIDTAISEGRLKKSTSASSTTILADSSEKLVAFIVKHQDSEDLFEYLGTFKKNK